MNPDAPLLIPEGEYVCTAVSFEWSPAFSVGGWSPIRKKQKIVKILLQVQHHPQWKGYTLYVPIFRETLLTKFAIAFGVTPNRNSTPTTVLQEIIDSHSESTFLIRHQQSPTGASFATVFLPRRQSTPPQNGASS